MVAIAVGALASAFAIGIRDYPVTLDKLIKRSTVPVDDSRQREQPVEV